jgi:hypothetical protein
MVAAGADPDEALQGIREEMRKAREAYCQEHGLDPVTGRPARATVDPAQLPFR